MRRDIILKAIFALGVFGVGWLSLIPQAALPETGLSDKLEHLLAYGVLGLAGCMAFPDHRKHVLVGLIFYGAALEGLQALVPGRTPSLLDGVANTLGVGFGYLILRLSRQIMPRTNTL